jgi:hypothetical protein
VPTPVLIATGTDIDDVQVGFAINHIG